MKLDKTINPICTCWMQDWLGQLISNVPCWLPPFHIQYALVE